ncbi:hypothetical protein M3Y99_00740000 [Aphelenchoides fujianensis]|nr:hypothetical protein M3Y99_00740000 [Aphelenchoides fujianensis]
MPGVTCREASDELRFWIVLTATVPAVINFMVTVTLVWAFFVIRSFRKTSEELISSTQWLSKTAVRVGIGPTAKKALLDYARTRPELQKLVPPAAPSAAAAPAK